MGRYPGAETGGGLEPVFHIPTRDAVALFIKMVGVVANLIFTRAAIGALRGGG